MLGLCFLIAIIIWIIILIFYFYWTYYYYRFSKERLTNNLLEKYIEINKIPKNKNVIIKNDIIIDGRYQSTDISDKFSEIYYNSNSDNFEYQNVIKNIIIKGDIEIYNKSDNNLEKKESFNLPLRDNCDIFQTNCIRF
jgi:hypothetical protein